MATLQSLGQEFNNTAYILKDFFGVPVMQIITYDGDIINMEGYEDL